VGDVKPGNWGVTKGKKAKAAGWGSKAAKKHKRSAWGAKDVDSDYVVGDDVDADDEKTIMSEWEEHMSDFVPEDMITFEIAARTTFEFN